MISKIVNFSFHSTAHPFFLNAALRPVLWLSLSIKCILFVPIFHFQPLAFRATWCIVWHPHCDSTLPGRPHLLVNWIFRQSNAIRIKIHHTDIVAAETKKSHVSLEFFYRTVSSRTQSARARERGFRSICKRVRPHTWKSRWKWQRRLA